MKAGKGTRIRRIQRITTDQTVEVNENLADEPVDQEWGADPPVW